MNLQQVGIKLVDKTLLTQATAKANTQWLNELLSETLPELSHLETPRDYQKWFNFLLDFMSQRGLKTPTQQKNAVTEIRNAIKVLNPEHPALDFVGFDKETWTDINNQATAVVADRETKFIHNPQAIADKARDLIHSDYWSEMAAGLAVVTGRRVSEVLKTAQFQYKTQYSIIFSGALKRRQEKIECVFEIPTLLEANEVITCLTKLRNHLGREIESLSPRQLSGGYSRRVSEVCNKEFSSLVEKRKDKDNLYTHLFRAVYSTIASHWFCPPKVPVIEYRAAIQGHYQILDEANPQLRRAIAADRNYFDYQIGDGRGNIDGRLGIKLEEPGVEVIEEFAHAYSPPPKKLSPSPPQEEVSKLIVTSQPRKTPPEKAPKEAQAPVTAITPKSLPPRKPFTRTSKSTMPEIPAFLGSRLDAISQQLELSEAETIKSMFDWVEVSISLAEELNLSSLDPHLLFETVQSLREQATANNHAIDSELNGGTAQEIILNLSAVAKALTDIQLSQPQTRTRTSAKTTSAEKRVSGSSSSSQTQSIPSSDKPEITSSS